VLMVSDLIDLARGFAEGGALRARAPSRFEARSETVPVIVWNVCRHCNMSCPHCYAAAGPSASSRDLSREEALGVLEQLARAGVRHVIFSGGEPLLRSDLLELVARAHALGLGAHLSSNGSLLDEAVAARLREAGVSYVGVSIDGMAAWNDDYRGLEGGFERASGGLRAAKAAGLRTGLRITVTRRNAAMLEPLIEHALELGVDRFYVSHLVYAGRARAIQSDDLEPAESRRLLESLFERALALAEAGSGTRIVTGGNDSDGALLYLWARDRWGESADARIHEMLLARGGNSAGESVLDIDHQGRVHPDQFWREAVLGDLRLQSFEEILAHPLRAQLADRESRLHGRCGGCAYLRLCRGSHRERALSRYGDLWASDPSCVLRDDELGGVSPQGVGGAS